MLGIHIESVQKFYTYNTVSAVYLYAGTVVAGAAIVMGTEEVMWVGAPHSWQVGVVHVGGNGRAGKTRTIESLMSYHLTLGNLLGWNSVHMFHS